MVRSQAERDAALGHLSELQAKVSKLQAELNAYGQCNPEQAEMKRRAVELAREAALRWTGGLQFRLRARRHATDHRPSADIG